MIRFVKPVAVMLVAVLAVPLSAAGPARVADAVQARDAATVRALLAKGVDVTATQPDGTTALHWAVRHDDLAMARRLLAAGAKVNAANRYGTTPLTLAAENSSASLISVLLAAGANANAVSGDGESVLMTAARTGNVPAIKALLAAGAHVNASEPWHGQTALMWAAAANHADAVRALLEGGAALEARTLVSTVPFTGGNEALLPATYNPAAAGFTALLFAVRAGHLLTVRTLVDAGANVNDALPGGMSALVLAVANAHYDVAVLLLDRGADANADDAGVTALHQLVWARNPNRHFNLPPPIPTGSVTDLDLAKALLDHGANINARVKREPRDGYRNWMNRIGATSYVLAAKAADAEWMRFLLANGADPHIKAQDHTTALMAAAGIGFWPAESPGTEAQALEAVTLAFNQGDDVNAANDGGYTALHGTAVRGANSIVRFLVDHGARLNEKTKREGWTPLTIAEGVFIANTFKFAPATAELLRQLGAERSAPVERPAR